MSEPIMRTCDACKSEYADFSNSDVALCAECEKQVGEDMDKVELQKILERRGISWVEEQGKLKIN